MTQRKHQTMKFKFENGVFKGGILEKGNVNHERNSVYLSIKSDEMKKPLTLELTNSEAMAIINILSGAVFEMIPEWDE